MTVLSKSIEINKAAIKELFGCSFDLLMRDIVSSDKKFCIISLDGMCDETKTAEYIIKPLTYPDENFGNDIIREIKTRIYKGTDIKNVTSIEDAAAAILAGNVLILTDNENTALKISVQGYAKRGVNEPQSEQNEKGSQEGFNDNFKDNITLLRRRLQTPDLITEQFTAGRSSNTSVVVCYMRGRAEKSLVDNVIRRIKHAKLDTVLGVGYLRPFLSSDKLSFFRDTGITERPDTLAAMLSEGRVGIIADGTPYAVIVPYLMSDYFHTVDDYLSIPYYAFFMRILRLLCFVASSVLPGLFVAVCLFHPEVLPSDIMYEIAAAESKTPFPIMTEALIIHFIYEIVREAGLRMPVAIGHAVSIVGALVIGDAAVTAGLIAAPMLIIVALTAISSSVVTRLNETVAILRFAFILVGGLTGLYGIMLFSGIILTDMCSVQTYGIPFTAPFSPLSKTAQRDNLLRQSWRKLGSKTMKVGEMKY